MKVHPRPDGFSSLINPLRKHARENFARVRRLTRNPFQRGEEIFADLVRRSLSHLGT